MSPMQVISQVWHSRVCLTVCLSVWYDITTVHVLLEQIVHLRVKPCITAVVVYMYPCTSSESATLYSDSRSTLESRMLYTGMHRRVEKPEIREMCRTASMIRTYHAASCQYTYMYVRVGLASHVPGA